MSDTNDVPKAPLVFICSDSLPSKSLFWLAKSTMANRTISPMYIPLIIFSNLKHSASFRHGQYQGNKERNAIVVIFVVDDRHTLITSVVPGSMSPRRFPDRISCGRRPIFRHLRTHPIRCSRSRTVSTCRRRKVRRFQPFRRNTRCSPFLLKKKNVLTNNRTLSELFGFIRSPYRTIIDHRFETHSKCGAAVYLYYPSYDNNAYLTLADELIKAKALKILLVLQWFNHVDV